MDQSIIYGAYGTICYVTGIFVHYYFGRTTRRIQSIEDFLIKEDIKVGTADKTHRVSITMVKGAAQIKQTPLGSIVEAVIYEGCLKVEEENRAKLPVRVANYVDKMKKDDRIKKNVSKRNTKRKEDAYKDATV